MPDTDSAAFTDALAACVVDAIAHAIGDPDVDPIALHVAHYLTFANTDSSTYRFALDIAYGRWP